MAFFDDKFCEMSSLASQTAAVYRIPDPLQYIGRRLDRRWSHSWEVIINYWDNKLKNYLWTEEGEEKTSSIFIDSTSLTTSTPMRIWQQAGLDSNAVKEATPVSWMN